MRLTVLLAALLVLSGCASTVPAPLRDVPENAPQPGEVQADPQRFRGERVRWGGTVVAVTNMAERTVLEIVARPLDTQARPRDVDRSLGRFLARVPGFLDPAVYARGREITVVGTVAGVQAGAIGEYPYRYPVVEVSARQLWQPRPAATAPPYAYDPFWYDPWYPRSLFYPYCPYGVSPRYCW